LHFAVRFGKNLDSLNLLLEAGADPTISVANWTALLHLVSSDFLPASPNTYSSIAYDHFNIMLELMYKHSHHYGLSTFQNHLGDTPLLTAFTFSSDLVPFDSTSHIQRLSFLLSKGCRIGEVDNNGFNCLHVLFSEAPPPALKDNDDILRCRPDGKDVRDSLVYIVRQGADVYATDRLGRSVSQFAYSETCWSTARELGSYCGDLWDAVLDLCGYDISQFRKGYPRRAMYTDDYFRQDFERLWEGREGRCPYWDDEDWCSPEDAEHGASLGVLQAPLCVSLGRHYYEGCCDYDDSESESGSEDDTQSLYDSDSDNGHECTGGKEVYGVDCSDEQDHYAASTDDGRSPQFPVETPSEWNAFDDRAHLSHYSQDNAPPLYEELSHNPWDEGLS
jgi:hypothetical protein